MISLRQHVFSLIAVFVALAIGIAAGSTVVRGPLLDSTRARLESAEAVIAVERAENDRMAAELDQLDSWSTAGPEFVLTGHVLTDAVVVVAVGDVDDDVVSGMLRSVRIADGAIAGEVRIDPSVFGAEAYERLLSVVDARDLVAEPPTDDAAVGLDRARAAFGELLAARLARAIEELRSGRAVRGADVLRTTFGDLEDDGLVDLLVLGRDELTFTGVDVLVLVDRNAGHDTEAVLARVLAVAGEPGDLLGDDPSTAVGAEVLVAEVGRVVDTETAGPSAVAGIRGDGRLRDEVSTVDNAETFLGWTAAVLALEVSDDQEVGHFGIRDGASGVLPAAEP